MNKEPTTRYVKAGKLAEALQQAWPDPKAKPASRASKKSSGTTTAKKGDTAAAGSRSAGKAAAADSAAKAKADSATKQNKPARSKSQGKKEQTSTTPPRKTNWLLRLVLVLVVLVVLVAGATCYISPVSDVFGTYLPDSVLNTVTNWVGATCPAIPPDTLSGP
jgi:Flp pilus assembly protein TadB